MHPKEAFYQKRRRILLYTCVVFGGGVRAYVGVLLRDSHPEWFLMEITQTNIWQATYLVTMWQITICIFKIILASV